MKIINSAYWARWQTRLNSVLREMEKQGGNVDPLSLTQGVEILEVAQLTKAVQAISQALRSCEIVLNKRGENEGA